MSKIDLPPPQRKPGTGPNPSGERAPVTKSVPRAPKAEQAPAVAPAAAEAAASAPAATPETAAPQEPKKKPATRKKAAPAPADAPSAAPEPAPEPASEPASAAPEPAPAQPKPKARLSALPGKRSAAAPTPPSEPASTPEAPPRIVDTHAPLPAEFNEDQFAFAAHLIIGEAKDRSILAGGIADLSIDVVSDLLSDNLKLDRTACLLMIRALEDRGVLGQKTFGVARKVLLATWPPLRVYAGPPPGSTPAAAPESDPLHDPPDPDAPKPLVPVKRPRPGERPAPAAAPEAAPAAPTAPPETAPASASAAPEPAPPADAPPAAPPADTTPPADAPPADVPPADAPDTPPTTPETPPAPPAPEAKKGFFESITSGFRSAADRFMARFRGEMTAQDEKDYEPTNMDVAASIAAGTISVVASYTGIKIVKDLPEWLTQKYFTAQERSHIKARLKAKEKELGADYGSQAAFDAKKATLEETIGASKFLTKKQQEKLIQNLKDVIDTRDYALVTEKEKRDQHIAKLLDEAIQSRIKNTQVLKETLNSALMVTGLSALRGAGYGAVALWERRSRLMKDENFMKQKAARGLDRKVTFFNDLIIGGMKDTWKQLKGGGVETKAGKAINFVQGATTVLRAAGFAELTINGIVLEDNISGTIDATLKAWESKVSAPSLENMAAPWERLGSLFGRASDAVVGAPEAPPVSGGGGGEAGVDTSPDVDTDSDTAPGTDTDQGGAVPSPDTTGPVPGFVEPAEPTGPEYTPEEIKMGTVRKGDGIIAVLQRQGLSAKEALAAARETGIVRPGGDTRLATEAIGRLSILVHETDGHPVIEFHDTQTGDTLSLDEARAQGFTYEHGGGPSVTAPVEAGPIAADEPEAEGTTDVPRTFKGGYLKLNPLGSGGFTMEIKSLETHEKLLAMTDASAIEVEPEEITGQIESAKTLSQKMASEMAILEKLNGTNLGDSSEAHLIRMNLKSELFNTGYSPGIFKTEELAKITVEVQKYDVDKILPVTTVDDRIADIRIPGLGKIEFTYEANGIPAFNINQLIENAKPILELRAQNMLVTGWQDTLAENYVTRQEMAIAGPIYLINEAIKELTDAGHGATAEAQYLKGQLEGYLRASSTILDGNNPIVKAAAERAGWIR